MTIVFSAPGSKSLTQRALLLAALADAPTEIAGGLDCDDSRLLRTALRALGTTIDDAEPTPPPGQPNRGLQSAATLPGPPHPEGCGSDFHDPQPTTHDFPHNSRLTTHDSPTWLVTPGPLRSPAAPVPCGNAGTTLRFLAALSLLLDAPLALDGDARMRRRPIGDLADALGTLGVAVRWTGAPGFPPLELRRTGPAPARVEIAAERSSQFASALLLVAPRLPAGLELVLRGTAVSRPYLGMTVAMLRAFGADARADRDAFRVAPGPLRCARLAVEGDWSGAAFLLAAGRITGRAVRVDNVSADSTQGDRAIVGFLEQLDRPAPRTFALGDCPDLIAPLAAAAAFADGPTELRGVAHARLKESDRVSVLAAGLRAAGCRVAELPDGLSIAGDAAPAPPVTLDPHGDHRMAMAFGLLSLRRPGIRVADRHCVSKSYPGFWGDLERFR